MGADDRGKRRDGENHMGCRRISHCSILQANPLDRYGLPQGLVDFKQYRGENTGPGSDFKPPRHLRQKLLNRELLLDSVHDTQTEIDRVALGLRVIRGEEGERRRRLAESL